MKVSLGGHEVYRGPSVPGFHYGVGDRDLAPGEGMRKLAGELGKEAPAFVHQVHGDRIVNAEEAAADGSTEADALLVSAGQGGYIRIADCVPVILLNQTTHQGAVVHAGWRGTFERIVEKAVRRLGAPGEVQAYIGPAIGRCCYRVSPELAGDFAARFGRGDWLVEHDDGPYLDLPQLNADQLRGVGVGTINVEGRCTRDAADLHSYRRDGADAGRLVAFLFVEPDRAA